MKKVITIFTLTAILFALSACGKTAKETYLEAHSNLMEADSYQTTSTINLNVETAEIEGMPEAQMVVGLLNNAEITAETTVDEKKQITETVIHLKTMQGPMSFELDIPVQMNMENQNMYIKTETIKQAMTMFPIVPMSQEMEFESEYVILDSEEFNMKEENQQQKQIEEMMKSVSEENFNEEDGQVTMKMEGGQVKDFVRTFLSSALSENGQMPKGMTEGDIEEGLKAIQFKELSVKSELDGSQLKKEEVSVGFSVKESGQEGAFQLDVKNEYENIGEDVSFQMNPTEENTMTQKQLEEKFNQMMMDSMMAPPENMQ
ncbi:hypothetical protein [Halobacillus yeomjeoni]|uniref:Lipoprotein n=1 Tax=Halobacillus yeomjeoni TaxID=311194 RepID=A0A931MTX8_9BACI|nr:hypothetical protein [Halobacillus yeomjeoni]MBH0228916.1 hypothetical protein [Halobacillus yeomjeoni]